jgi:hypothetical protein
MKRATTYLILLFVFTAIHTVKAQTSELARVKAIFILNFIKYSDHQAANGAEEFVVGIYQDEKLAQELAKICGNSYHGKRVVVQQLTDLHSPVHLLFVPEEKHFNYLAYIKKNGTISNTMIVTDKTTETTMIGFEIHDKRFYFRLNEELLAKNGIKLAESIKAIAINNRS